VPACPQCAAEFGDEGRFCGRCGAPLEPAGAGPGAGEAEADPWIGRVVDDRYRVQARIGSGGMGVVYRVEHLQLGKTAAMKVLSADTARDRQMVQRFRLEAKAVSRLNHPNIVQTFDFGRWDGALYLVMEFVKGDDLAAVLRQEGPLPFARAARFFIQVCSALTEAHDTGIIHRDLKPENLMLVRRRDGVEHAKVLDFGLAKLREREDAGAITSGAQVLGTPYYMAPEQVRGEALDPRTDIYSLGATLYRTLTGAPPFQANSPMAVLSKHLTDEVIPPCRRAPERELPPEADQIVLRAMAKDLEERYPSAAEVQRDLERALAALGTQAEAPALASTVPRPVATPRRQRAPLDSPTVSIDDSDLGDGERLRRRDLDAFERSLRRRRLARFIVPVALVALAGGAALFVTRKTIERPDTVEHEPNNTPGYANLLPLGVPVQGKIGALIEGGQADVDYYRIPSGRGARVASARLEGIPGVDLVLELFDAQGRRVAKSDAHGRGWGEWLQPTSIGPTEAYLAVRQVWVEGEKPVENVPEPYALTVQWGPPQPGWELEPNDWEAAATPVPGGGSVRGYLGSPEDVDWFVIMPDKPGPMLVRVSAPAGVDVVLALGEEAEQGQGQPGKDTRGARRKINAQGPGGEEQVTAQVTPGRPVLIEVSRKLAAGRDPKAQDVPGLDEPYELRTGD
jgi:serine/threonine-protein kinase